MKKWSVDKRASLRIKDEDGNTIANASGGQSGDDLDKEQRNAKLIAATPDLIEALADLCWLVENYATMEELQESVMLKGKPLLDKLNIKYEDI